MDVQHEVKNVGDKQEGESWDPFLGDYQTCSQCPLSHFPWMLWLDLPTSFFPAVQWPFQSWVWSGLTFPGICRAPLILNKCTTLQNAFC